MGRTAALVVGVLLMIAVIVTIDVLFLREHLWWRLVVNVGVVLASAALYFRFRGRL
jgi:hypothetical protein